MWEEKGERSKGDAWWWNDKVLEAVLRKKEAPKVMFRNSKRRIRGGIKA